MLAKAIAAAVNAKSEMRRRGGALLMCAERPVAQSCREICSSVNLTFLERDWPAVNERAKCIISRLAALCAACRGGGRKDHGVIL